MEDIMGLAQIILTRDRTGPVFYMTLSTGYLIWLSTDRAAASPSSCEKICSSAKHPVTTALRECMCETEPFPSELNP